jgi:hypothetical protein
MTPRPLPTMAGMSPLMLWRDRVWISHFLMTVTAGAITKSSNWMVLMNTILRLGNYTITVTLSTSTLAVKNGPNYNIRDYFVLALLVRLRRNLTECPADFCQH